MADQKFHKYTSITCFHCGHTFDVPVYCGNRFCEICSFPRRRRVRDRLDFLISQIEFKRGFTLKHVTLTIKNQPDLAPMVKHIMSSFRRLRQTRMFKYAVDGGAFVIEITGSRGNWHAHIHAIMHCKYIPHSMLVDNWLKCSGSRGCFITLIPTSRAVGYLTKYLSKPDVAPDLLQQVSDSMKGLRLFTAFGTWYATNRKFPKPLQLCPDCGDGCCYELSYKDEHTPLQHIVLISPLPEKIPF